MVDDSPVAAARESFLQLQKERASRPASSQNGPRHNKFDKKKFEQSMREDSARNQKLISIKREQKAASIADNVADWKKRIDVRWTDACIENLTDEGLRSTISERVARHRFESGRNQSSLLLYGDMGRGKTYAGYAYAYELIKSGHMNASNAYIATEQTLAQISRAGFKADSMWNEILNPRLKFYLIDDIGRAVFSDEVRRKEIWHTLLDHIYGAKLTIVLTTNLDITKRNGVLYNWLGDSGYERLVHMVGLPGMILVEGENQREIVGKKLESDYKRNASAQETSTKK